MTPQEFIQKWRPVALTERQTAQEHFIDLCRLFGHPTPVEADPTGETYCFEKGAMKATGNPGFADVWKRGFFAFEYKKRKKNLKEAQDQLARYAWHLENPPIHVACDTNLIRVITAFNNAPTRTFDITLDDLANHEKRAILEAVFFDPERLRGHMTREMLTREAADAFSAISERLQHRHREAVAHFVNQLVFCFFAEDVRLLPEGLFKKKLLQRALQNPDRAKQYLDELFAAMEAGGEFALEPIAHFNGGLFDGRRALPLEAGEIDILVKAAGLTWSEIDPTIFGTLFERFLDPDKRAQIGAHYTDETKIMMIVEPVIMRPLMREWEAAKAEIEGLLAGTIEPPTKSMSVADRMQAGMRLGQRKKLKPREAAEEVRARFLHRLATLSILDPACGSGNFLYLALQAVKDLELHVNTECEALGLPTHAPMVGPEILHGIEINPLAAELARTTIWIGHIQWGIRNSFYTPPAPILRKLDTIECRDALICCSPHEAAVIPGRREAAIPESRSTELESEAATDSSASVMDPVMDSGLSPSASPGMTAGGYIEAAWPAAEFIVGNPPFLGVKKMLGGLGEEYTMAIRSVYEGQVSPFSDLVCWWFEKARAQIVSGKSKRAGLVATNSIRGGKNRLVLDAIDRDLIIFEAWSNEPWVVEGAAVRVSLVCFGCAEGEEARLDGHSVATINPDLTGGSLDLTKAKRLSENRDVAFIGIQKSGPLDIPGDLARKFSGCSTQSKWQTQFRCPASLLERF